jgi:hypothetical protein
MATPSMLPPPPGGDTGQSAVPQPPPTPQVGSPSAPEPAPQSNMMSNKVIGIIQDLRSLARAIPGAAPGIAEINEIFSSKVMPAIMAHQRPGEPAAPPMGG